jgi:hypothetical protein
VTIRLTYRPDRTKTMSPLPNERGAVGRSRIPVCQALKDRALRLLDTHGIMRRPSLEGLKSLLLLSNLMMGEIPKGWEEGQDAEMDREVSVAHAISSPIDDRTGC